MCADLKKSIEIIFGGKNEISKIIGDIEKDFAALDRMVTKLTDPLAALGSGILKLDAALAGMAIGGLAYAVKQAGEFNGKFGEITTLIDDVGAPIDNFKKNILDYSTSSVKSIDQINQSLYTAVSAGVDYKKSIDFIAQAEKLSVAGRSDLDTTTKVLISTLNAYGAGTDQAAKYSDTMFTTVKLGLTTMTELSSSLAMVTGLASTSGIPFETLSAAIAALTVAGLPTSQAITGIRQAIQNIIKPSKEAEEAAQSLGIKFDDTALKTKGLETVLWDAYKATGGNIGKMGELFGSVESLNTVMILGADKTGNFSKALTAMGTSAGATQVAYNKVANEFENINQRLANNFKVTLVEIGERLMPEYGLIAGSLGDLMKGIKVGVEYGAFDPLFNELDKVGGGISKWLADVGKAFPEALKNIDFSALVDSLKNFREAATSAFSISTADPKALSDAMQLVVDSLTSLVDVTRGMGEVFAPLLNSIKEAIKAFNNMDSDTKVLMGNVLGLAVAYKAFGPLGLILVGMGLDAEDMAKVMGVAFGGIENGINTLKVAVLSLAMMFATATQSVSELLAKIPGYDADGEMIKRTSERVKIIGDLLEEAQTKLAVSSNKVMDAMTGTGEATKKATSRADDYGKALGQIPVEVEKITAAVAKLPDKKQIVIGVQADGSSIEIADEMIIQRFPDGRVLITNVAVAADEANLKGVQKTIDKEVLSKKEVEVKAKFDLEKFKAETDKVSKMIEWTAKLNISQVEAETKRLETIFKSLDNTVTSTGTTLSSIIGTYAQATSAGKGGTWEIQKQIDAESRRRDAALELQKELIQTQVKLMLGRVKLMEEGKAMIEIDGKGLQPHLEAFMFEILSAIQVRATAEGQKYLVGI